VGHEKLLTRIELGDEADRLLAARGRTRESVLPAGETQPLRATANLSTGGTAADRTDVIHPDNAEIARRAARVVGLDVAGIDIVTPDISRPLREVGGAVLEVNAAPGFRMHLAPTEGRPRDVAGPVIDSLFPPGTQATIPIVAITGTNGKTTTARMVAHILKMAGKRVGLTTTDGLWIDGEEVLAGDLTGPWGARAVLRDPVVEAAVLETARGGILREGLGFSRCDVGVVLNVSADHLGLKGVETLDDLAFVKRLVLEVVRDDGVSVMNADDPLVAAMAAHAEGRHAYFSMRPDDARVREHVREGGLAAVREGDRLVLFRAGQRIPLLDAAEVPATVGGRAHFNVENALAAALVAFAGGVSLEHVRQGLRTFDATWYQAPGRLNVHELGAFRAVVDYAHNPAAMRAMVDFAARMGAARVVGVVGAAGDRRDEDIRALGEVAGRGFHRVIVREDADTRGRARGEAAELLRQGALAGGCRDVSVVLDEARAFRTALDEARPGDLILLFADDLAAATRLVREAGARGRRVPEPA
jgi:cyanophycin synthetase